MKRIAALILFIVFFLCGYANASTRAIQIDLILAGLVNQSTGEAVSLGSVEFYEAGTTTAKNVWTEVEKTNPYTSYTLDAVGAAHLYGEGNYKIVIKDSDGGLVDTLDDIRLEFPYYGIRTVIQTGSQLSEDDFLLINTTSGDITINCLESADWTRPLKVQRITGGNDIIIDPYNSETIDGSATLTITSDAIVEIISDGSNLRTAGFRSSFADSDNDTKVQVEESADEDKIRFDTGGTERVVIDSSGLDIQSGGFLIGGSEKISSSGIISGLNFSQDGYIYITDTGNTTFENPIQILAPNIDDAGTIRMLVGKDSNTKNYGYIDLYHASDQSASNYAEFGLTGGGYARFDGSGNVGVGKTSGGAKLDVNGEIEGTSLDVSGNADIDGTTNLDNTDIDGTVDISSTLDIGASTTRRVAPAGTFANNSNGNPNISDTTVLVDNVVTVDTWESIGPTGSGADNIWTALDSIPTDADWIEVFAAISGATLSGGSGCHFLATNIRKNGSSESYGSDNVLAQCYSCANSSGQSRCSSTGDRKVFLNSGVFDVYYNGGNFDADSIILHLNGWGFNP